MAGRRTSGLRAGRSSEDEASYRDPAARSGAESGTGTDRSTRTSREIRTRPTVRLLTLRGLAQSEAINLTAFLCGIPATERGWELREINQLLFLRALRRNGRFGRHDGSR